MTCGTSRQVELCASVQVMKYALLLLRWGGVALWANVAITELLDTDPSQPIPLRLAPILLMGWLASLLLLLLAYWRATELWRSRRKRQQWAWWMVGAMLALLLLLPASPTQNQLLILTATVLPSVIPWRWVAAGIALQSVTLASASLGHLDLHAVLRDITFWVVAQCTMALLIKFVTQERLAREQLAQSNAQLHFTRSLLEHTSREAERMRIARDLHDMLGHHLTVLGLELEVIGLQLRPVVAVHPQVSQAIEGVMRAQTVQRQLMHDVRGTVDALRAHQMDLLTFTRSLQRNVPQLRVHLSLPDPLPSVLAQVDTVLMRFMQESLTNTLRHAQAQNVWLHLECHPGQVQIRATDDGRCPCHPQLGHGLRGLQERFAGAGGEVLVLVQDGRLQLHGVLPLGEKSS